MKDFTPLTLATSSPNTTVVKADAPWKTLEEFIADAKKNPGQFTYGSAGPGTTPHFIGELVKLKTKIDLTHVPLGSESAAATAVLGGHVNIAFLTLGTTRSHIEAGTMRAFAVASNRRLKDFPNVPTTVEKGFPELNLKIWVGFFAPAKTPPAIVKRLAGAISESLKDAGDRRAYRKGAGARRKSRAAGSGEVLRRRRAQVVRSGARRQDRSTRAA